MISQIAFKLQLVHAICLKFFEFSWLTIKLIYIVTGILSSNIDYVFFFFFHLFPPFLSFVFFWVFLFIYYAFIYLFSFFDAMRKDFYEGSYLKFIPNQNK